MSIPLSATTVMTFLPGGMVAVGFAMFAAALLMAVVVLASVALGAWIVYKTKREDSSLFAMPEKDGAVLQAPGEYEDDEIPMGSDTTNREIDSAVEHILKQNRRFTQQRDTEGGKGT